jgi:hypothetical protein
MPSPELMNGLEGMGATYAMRLRSNSRLDEASQAICPRQAVHEQFRSGTIPRAMLSPSRCGLSLA